MMTPAEFLMSDLYTYVLIWLAIGRFTCWRLQPTSLPATLACFVAWPFILPAMVIVCSVRAFRRWRDFPRATARSRSLIS